MSTPTSTAPVLPVRRTPAPLVAGSGLLALALSAGLVGALPGQAGAAVVPPTPSGLPVGVEAYQPYVGQEGCDPVAKPGVAAFQRLLMDTYRDTGSSGIVRDCGIGGTSEHKEGRAFDWRVSASNASHVAEVEAVTTWLTATVNGVPAANARRLGLMYMIWNRQIWKAYQADRGWQPYSGVSPHTDHVHFSFGWNGAKQSTSWWTKKVAPIDYGPYLPALPTSVDPVASPDNLRVLGLYGGLTLSQGSSGDAVRVVQATLRTTVDGSYGSGTATKVREFQESQGLPGTGVFGPTEWARLFPKPVDPFGDLDTATATGVSGWAIDADTSAPLQVQVLLDGQPYGAPVTANVSRPDLGPAYPGVGTAHGFAIPVAVPDGQHALCVTMINVGPGTSTRTGCGVVDNTAKITAPAMSVRQAAPGALATGTFSFGVSRPADWTLTVRRGATVVRTLQGSTTGAVSGTWDGRDDRGQRAGGGAYTATVTLRGSASTWSTAFALTAAPADLFTVSTKGTASGRVEVHTLSAASQYRAFSLHAATAQPTAAAGTWQYLFGPANDAGQRDLYLVGSGSGTGNVEVHVLTAASGYQQWSLHEVTAMPVPGAGEVEYTIASFDGSGRPDLYAIRYARSGTGRVEVHALSAASRYKQWVWHSGSAFGQTAPGTWSWFIDPRNGDLTGVARGATGSGRTEVHAVSRASGFTAWTTHAATPFGPLADSAVDVSMADPDGDGAPDLAAVVFAGTGSGMTEVHTVSAASGFQTFITHAATALGALNPASWFTGLGR